MITESPKLDTHTIVNAAGCPAAAQCKALAESVVERKE